MIGDEANALAAEPRERLVPENVDWLFTSLWTAERTGPMIEIWVRRGARANVVLGILEDR